MKAGDLSIMEQKKSKYGLMNDGSIEAFDGMSLIQWTEDNRICFLKEFGCNENRYDPYQDGAKPKFRDEKAMWF